MQRHLFALAIVFSASAAMAQSAVQMREPNTPGTSYSVQARVEIAGQLTLPAEKDKPAPLPVTMTGSSAIDYDERLLAPLPDRPGSRSIRLYRNAEFRRTVGSQTTETKLRPAARRMVVVRLGSREVPFSPDAPLTLAEVDIVRTDVYTPALSGLLPDRAVNVGETWKAATAAVEELTDMEKITDGSLDCRLESVSTEQGRRIAKVQFSGKIRGVNEDGPNEQQLSGAYAFDLDHNFVAALTLNGIHLLLDGKGNPAGKVEGKFRLDRRLISDSPELTDAALKGLTLEPNSENTLLVFEGSASGMRFLYPRRWRVSSEVMQRVTLQEPRGNGLLIVAEPPAKVPTTAAFLKEAQDFLVSQKGKIIRVDPAQSIRPAPREIDRFGLDVEIETKPARMEYYIARQPGGGATVAARLIPGDAPVLRPEVEQIVKSLQIAVQVPAGVKPLTGQ